MGMIGWGPWSSEKREEQEFQRLIESHLDALYRVALRFTRDPTLAEDLVQDTVVRALRFRHQFEMGSHFMAWSCTILHNIFLQRYRRSKRERELLQGYERADVKSRLYGVDTLTRANNPEGNYTDNALSDNVAVALDNLPEHFSQVVMLRDIEGLSYKEIAEVLDIAAGTVMSRLHRGRKMLAENVGVIAAAQAIGVVKTGPAETMKVKINQNTNNVVSLRRPPITSAGGR